MKKQNPPFIEMLHHIDETEILMKVKISKQSTGVDLWIDSNLTLAANGAVAYAMVLNEVLNILNERKPEFNEWVANNIINADINDNAENLTKMLSLATNLFADMALNEFASPNPLIVIDHSVGSGGFIN